MEVSLLGKMKLYELAKELNLTSKELLKKAGEIGIQVKSHLSNLESEEVEKIKKNIINTVQNENKKPESKDSKKYYRETMI